MSKAPDTQQGDSHVRAGEQADHTRADHQQGAHGDHHLTGHNQVHAKPALEQRWQVAADDTAQVCKQHWHPGEHRDLFQVKAVNFKHEQRDPGVKCPPGRFCQEAWQSDTPELTGAQDLPDGHLFAVVGLMLGFLTINNVVTFFVRQLFLVARVFIEDQPRHGPGKAQHTGDDERHLPAVHHNRPHHQWRSNHRPDGGAHVEVTDSDRTLFCREPFRAGFQTRGDHRCFGSTYRTTRQRQSAPTAGQRGRPTEDGPGYSEEGITNFCTQNIKNITCYRLHYGVSGRVSRNDVRVLLRGDM